LSSVSSSFHVTEALDHASFGDHASSLRTPSLLTRHTASSFTQRSAQKSAVARRCRSGDGNGSLGSSICFPFVRCRRVKVVLSPCVVYSTTAFSGSIESHRLYARPPARSSV